MERQLHGTSYIVQARGKGCEQPEPINFHIPFQSDLKTKRAAFSAGTLQRERGKKRKMGKKMIQQSANSEKGQEEWAWRDESAMASGDGGKEAFVLCWFVQPDWSQPSTGTALEQKLPDGLRTLRGEKSSSHTEHIFIKYILWPPSSLDIFLLTYSRPYRWWGRWWHGCCVGFFMCMVTGCGVVNFKQGCVKFNRLILNYRPLAAKAVFWDGNSSDSQIPVPLLRNKWVNKLWKCYLLFQNLLAEKYFKFFFCGIWQGVLSRL